MKRNVLPFRKTSWQFSGSPDEPNSSCAAEIAVAPFPITADLHAETPPGDLSLAQDLQPDAEARQVPSLDEGSEISLALDGSEIGKGGIAERHDYEAKDRGKYM